LEKEYKFNVRVLLCIIHLTSIQTKVTQVSYLLNVHNNFISQVENGEK
jgi:hypothetical protein